MPKAPLRPCRFPGCGQLCKAGKVYCDTHEPENGSDAQRGSSSERGYDAKWRKARRRFLQRNPLCIRCLEYGKVSTATVVDHIIPHRGDKLLFWDERNWQPLCKSCHDAKTGQGL